MLVQPPKVSVDSKLVAIHEYLVASCTCFALKELENISVFGTVKIRSAEVKALLKNLTDEGLVQCEKIGTGNWYWTSWRDPSADSKAAIQTLTTEKRKREESLRLIQEALLSKGQLIGDTPMLFDRADRISTALERNKVRGTALQRRLIALKSLDSMATIGERSRELEMLREYTERWEDNLDILKSYVTKISGGDYDAFGRLLLSLRTVDEQELEVP